MGDRWRRYAKLTTRGVNGALGLSSTYTPPGGTPIPLIKAPFDAAYESLELQDGVPISTVQPVWDVDLADLPVYPAQDGVVELRPVGAPASVRFVVTDIRDGGQGTAKLFLVLESRP